MNARCTRCQVSPTGFVLYIRFHLHPKSSTRMHAVRGWAAYGKKRTFEAMKGASNVDFLGVYVFTLPGMS